jgi:hypothetical protein
MEEVISIAILTCWYGKYPWYFPYFIHSCRYNPTVDFIIITDNQETIINKPENVKIIHKTLEQVKSIASQKLGFTVTIDNSYKLCDFKPTYGLLFSEILNEYDFWGHGDIDMVYGNIRGFMTAGILNNHDIISSRKDIITGTFCLYRNNEQMRTLFMQSRDYKKVLSNPEHFSFGECNFLDAEMQHGLSIFDFPDNIQSMTYVAKKGIKEGKFRAYFQNIILQSIAGNVKWDRGKIFYNETEFMFYDLLIFKKICKNTVALDPIPDEFYFDRKGIAAIKNYCF